MTQDKHHDIDKLFQDAFLNHESPPPFNMWNKIEGNLPLTETDMIFKNAFENYEKQPSEEVWERIKPELPLSLTLRNALMHLSRIAAVLLIGMTTYIFVQQFDWNTSSGEIAQQQSVEVEENKTVVQEEYYDKDILTDDEILNEPLAILEKEEVAINIAPISTPTAQTVRNSPFNNPDNTAKGANGDGIIPNKVYTKEAILNIDVIAKRIEEGNKNRIPSGELFFVSTVETEEISKPDSTMKDDGVRSLKNPKMEDAIAYNIDIHDGKIRRPYKGNEGNVSTTAALPYLSLGGAPDAGFQRKGVRIKRSSLEQQAFNFTGLYANANATFGTSSILNKDLKELMAGSTGNYNVLSKGHSFGLNVGYQFKPKWSIEAGANYRTQTQSYTNSTDTDEKVSFNYVAIPVTLKYRSNEISGVKPSSVSYVFGVQTAFLDKKEIVNFIPISTPDAQDLMIQKEIGLTAGVDYDLYLNPNLSWTIGARATVGTDVNNAFDNYNTFVGIRSAFNFRLGK